ncbi:MAG: phage holin, LLH family [Eubacteriales bacterium]|jgi:xanthosine utilization system XapX-like protein|nr:phage holin, LLH family [Eubacteriales bacterium]
MKKYLMVFLLTLVAMTLVTLPIALAEATDPAPVPPGIDMTQLFQAVIGFLAALVTYKLIPWIQARTTAQQQELLRAAVSVAVYAAEQLYGAGAGKEKLMYVKGQLAKKGYHVDIDEIEAAVRELTIIGE